MPQVFIPPALRRVTDGQRQIEVEGRTVRQLVDQLDQQFPGFRDRVCDAGRFRQGIAVAVGSRISDLGLLEPVADDDEVHFVFPVSGG